MRQPTYKLTPIGRKPLVVIMMFATLLCGSVMTGAAEPIEINIGYYETVGALGQHSHVMDDIIDRFVEQHPHIKVTTTVAGYRQFYERLPVELAAGVGPDVWLSDGVLVDQYASQGFALDLTDRIENLPHQEDYFGIEDNRDPSGRIWAFPQGLQSSALFYNREMFDSAGINYPTADWTYDDVRGTARSLTIDRDGSGTPNQYGFRVINHVTEGWFPIIKAFGGSALDATRQKSLFADPKTIAGLEFMVDILHQDGTSPLIGSGDRFAWFPTQVVAMQTGVYTRTYAPNQAGVNYDVTLMPSGPAGRFNPVIVNSWIINSRTSTEKQEAAWEWIQFFADEEAQTIWGSLDEAIPVNREVALELFRDSDMSPKNRIAFIEGLAHSTPLDPNPVWNDWVSAATSALNPAFQGRVSVTEAATNANHMVQVILDAFYEYQ